MIRPLFLIFWSFATIFFFCENAERVTGRFEEIDDSICQSDWYSYPIELQRMIITVMMGTQKPVIVRGFGNLLFTRQSFKQVNLRKSFDRIKVFTVSFDDIHIDDLVPDHQLRILFLHCF